MTPSGIVALPLETAGLDRLSRALEGGSSLSRSILETHPEGTGEAVALVPPGTGLERALRLDEGGLLRRDVAIEALRAMLEAPMSAPGAAFIVEHRLARRGDPALEQKRVRISFFGEEVYCWSAEAAEIPEVLRAAASHGVNCFVSVADLDLGEEISEAELEALAGATRSVAISPISLRVSR